MPPARSFDGKAAAKRLSQVRILAGITAALIPVLARRRQLR
jgi:hypothetical protein